MCGILGIITNYNNGAQWKDAEVLENLLYFDALRGKDSTGIGMFTNEAGLRLVKGAIEAAQFLETAEWKSIRTQWVSNGKAIIGHNRKKTIGSISDENAHPFLIDDKYLFIHNGTLSSHKHLADKEIDSEALGIHLTKCKTKEELEEALSKVYGAYACAWIDKEKETLYLLRNRERPLYYGKFDTGWAFCSEPGFLKLAFARNGIKMEETQEVPVDSLISFDLKENKIEPITQALTIKKYQPTTPQQSTQSYIHGSGGHNVTKSGEGFVSKNQFKRFQKKGLIGSKILFEMEDYKEVNPNDPQPSEWEILGTCKTLDFNHMVKWKLSGTDKETLYNFYLDLVWSGTVEKMLYDPNQKLVNIYVKDVNWEISVPRSCDVQPTMLQ